MWRKGVALPVLAAALLLSVPLKAWTIIAGRTASGPAPEVVLAERLGEMGLATHPETRLIDRPALVGEAGSCRVWMGLVSGDGWHRNIVLTSAPPTMEVVFFFKGRAYADQPTWATWFDEKASVLARSFAMPVSPSPVVAAYLGPGCPLDRAALAERLRDL